MNATTQPTPANTDGLRANDPHSWLETVWDGLQAWREDLIPEGDESYDEQWSDACTAMAWITEALGLEAERGLVSCPSCNELVEFDNLADSETTHQQWRCPCCGSWNDRADRDEPPKTITATVWVLAGDDSEGTWGRAFATEREAEDALLERLDESRQNYEEWAANNGDDFWVFVDDNKNDPSLDTYQIDSVTLDLEIPKGGA